MDVDLKKSIKELKGIGEKKAQALNKLGVYNFEDLLNYYPRKYIDKRNITEIVELVEGQFSSVKVIIKKPIIEMKTKTGLLISRCIGEDSTGKLDFIWYNNRFIKNYIKTGEEYIFYGKIKKIAGKLTMEYPEYEGGSGEDSLNLLRIVPDYPLTQGVTQKDIRKFMDQLIKITDGKLKDLFPESLRLKDNLAEYNFAISNLHQPETEESLSIALNRFKYEEFFTMFSGLELLRQDKKNQSIGIKFNKKDLALLYRERLPYKLTNAQERVLLEIFNDMIVEKPMNRLLQGDVGSGKTIIAMMAMYLCSINDFQSVIIAPTEILARQHFESLTDFFKETGKKVGLLVGSLSKKEKLQLLNSLENGDIDVLAATHAVLEDNVIFKNLGLAITDEQHRFGVKQRLVLNDKGKNPDILVMSATPIPRTLSLIIYGDLDISVIDELPPKRKSIETFLIDSSKVDRMYGFIKNEIKKGNQVYIVCPLVEDSEALELKSAMTHSEFLKSEIFCEEKLEMIHGKLKAKEKDQIMQNFKNGETKILVSTTVIEVGVNVPNATVMVIENAERFGMAQLHQLRGRIGRGSEKSFCIMISDSKNENSRERLKFLSSTTDGFKIAEKDLETRGAGEILGLKQHGLPDLILADLVRDHELLLRAKETVKIVYSSDEYVILKKVLEERFEKKLREIALN